MDRHVAPRGSGHAAFGSQSPQARAAPPRLVLRDLRYLTPWSAPRAVHAPGTPVLIQ
jgi:hypothetical protein